jgi:nucleotide-binding universal stress UspA family protein
MKRILVATDGSASSAEAVTFGADLAAEHEAELHLVHVVPVLDVVPSGLVWLGGAVLHEPTAAERLVLEDAAAVVAERGVLATTALLHGDTVGEIVFFADSRNVDLIVVGSRGRGSIVNGLLGSTSRRLLSESRRPVLVVRGTAHVREPVGVGLGM